jgi:hypothetical protein
MRALLLAGLAGAGLLASTFAFADDVKPVTPAPAAANGSDRVVCHAVVADGMVVHKSDCHTQKEWDQIRRASQQSITQFQMNSLTQQVR